MTKMMKANPNGGELHDHLHYRRASCKTNPACESTNIDLYFHGQMGLYTLTAESAQGRKWARRNVCFESWQGNPADGITIEGGGNAEDICQAAFEAGMVCFVNNRKYIGDGHCEAA